MATTSAYWVNPYGQISPVTKGSHIADIIANPNKFGISRSEIESAYKKYGEKIGVEGKAREEIILDVLKGGFIRIRQYRTHWSVTVDQLSRKIKNSLIKWAEAQREDKRSDNYLPVHILTAKNNKLDKSKSVNDVYFMESVDFELEFVDNCSQFRTYHRVTSFKDFINEESSGTYAGIKFSWDTIQDLRHFIVQNKIPSTITNPDFHSTLLYSRKQLSDYTPLGTIDEDATFKGFSIWEGKGGKNALVMEIQSQWMIDRHNELMNRHDATYDFDEYKPHVTLSYDVGDFDASKLPRYAAFIQLRREYTEDLDLEWNK